jgi:VanZ family protein
MCDNVRKDGCYIERGESDRQRGELHILTKSQLFKSLPHLLPVLVLSSVLFLGVSLPQFSNLLERSLFDLSHFPLFVLIGYSALLCFKPTLSDRWTRWATALMAPLLFGALIEVVQTQVGRRFSFYDLWNNLLGIVVALLFYLSWKIRAISINKALLAAFVLMAIALNQPLYWAWLYWERHQAMPDLLNIDSPLRSLLKVNGESINVVEIINPEKTMSATQLGAKVPLYGSRWAGITWREPEPDWRGYTDLTFEIYSPLNYRQEVVLRIHDRQHNNQYHDRYNQRFDLHPGYNQFTVKLKDVESQLTGRLMDLSHIAGISIFSSEQPAGTEVYLLSFRLMQAK